MKTLIRFIATLALIGTAFAQQYVGPQWPVAAPLAAAATTITTAIPQSQGNTIGGLANAGNTTVVCLASATGVQLPALTTGVGGSYLFVDREMMQVVGQLSTLCFRVIRGVMSTPAQYHAVNSEAWVGNADTFSGDTSRPTYTGLFPMEDASPAPLPTIQPAFGTTPSSAVPVANTIYWSEIQVEHTRPVTGICVLNGSTIGTDNHQFALYDYGGNLLAQTTATLAASASLYQCLPFTSNVFGGSGPIEISGDRLYFIAFQSNGTTATIQKYITGEVGPSFQAGSQTAASFVLPSTILVPFTFTTATGPIAELY